MWSIIDNGDIKMDCLGTFHAFNQLSVLLEYFEVKKHTTEIEQLYKLEI